MDDRNDDLPLVVSEILIEMHGLNERMTGVEKAINRMAEVMLPQQQETNKKLELLMEGGRSNTAMPIEAFREEASASRQRLESIENRLERLENK